MNTVAGNVKNKLARLPVSTKLLLAIPTALLMTLLIVTTPILGVPLAALLLLTLRPELLSPTWWRRQMNRGG